MGCGLRRWWGEGASGNSYCCCLGRCQVQWLLVSSVIVSSCLSGRWRMLEKQIFILVFARVYICVLFFRLLQNMPLYVCVCGWCEGPIVRGCCPRLCLLAPPRHCRCVVAMPRDIPGDISHKTSTQIYKFIWACSPIASCTACFPSPHSPTPSLHLTVSQLWRWRAGRARFLYALSSQHRPWNWKPNFLG